MLVNQIAASGKFQVLQSPDDGTQGGGAGTPATQGTETTLTSSQGQAVTPSANVQTSQGSGVPNDPQAAIRAMNEAQRQAAELRKQVEAYQKYGEPEALGQQLERLQYIDNNPQIVVTNYIKEHPETFNSIAQQIGPQAAFQMIGNQLFNQPQQDPNQKYRDVYAQTGDVGELVAAIKTDMKSEFNQLLDQRLQSVSQPIQALQTNQHKTALEAQLATQSDKLNKLGITKEKVMQTIEANKMPYEVALTKPFLLTAMITEAAGGLDTLLTNASTSAVQTRQQEILNNFQTSPTLTPGGGVNTGEVREPITDNKQVNKAGHEMLNQILSQTKT